MLTILASVPIEPPLTAIRPELQLVPLGLSELNIVLIVLKYSARMKVKV